MRVPASLSENFRESFQELIGDFLSKESLLTQEEVSFSTRFLNRSVVPHIMKLSDLFNRKSSETIGLNPYWKKSANPKNLRLAYFLYFMPTNLYRIAAVWNELGRLGYQWNSASPLSAIELGAGPATGTCGIAVGEKFAQIGLPKNGSFALIESDQNMLKLGKNWATYYFEHLNHRNWSLRTYPRRIDLTKNHSILPSNAPRFNLWILSYFLNEFDHISIDPWINTWKKHLSDEGLIIIIEPALKEQSRRLLEFRRKIIESNKKNPSFQLKVLLPCLGEQSCGALNDIKDWCHEEVLWWRPPYLKALDDMVKLDHKTLPFSYLVLTKSDRSIEEILPAFKNSLAQERYRLVSPSHWEGKSLEFYICGQNGKTKSRYKPEVYKKTEKPVDRGNILCGEKII